MWELVVYMGITWAGVSQASVNPMPDKTTCFEVLNNMKINQTVGGQSSVEKGNSVIALCRPKQDKVGN